MQKCDNRIREELNRQWTTILHKTVLNDRSSVSKPCLVEGTTACWNYKGRGQQTWQLWRSEPSHTTKKRNVTGHILKQAKDSEGPQPYKNMYAERKLKKENYDFWENSHWKNTVWDEYIAVHTKYWED